MEVGERWPAGCGSIAYKVAEVLGQEQGLLVPREALTSFWREWEWSREVTLPPGSRCSGSQRPAERGRWEGQPRGSPGGGDTLEQRKHCGGDGGRGGRSRTRRGAAAGSVGGGVAPLCPLQALPLGLSDHLAPNFQGPDPVLHLIWWVPDN